MHVYSAPLSFSYFTLELAVFYPERPAANYLEVKEPEFYTPQQLFQFHRADVFLKVYSGDVIEGVFNNVVICNQHGSFSFFL